MRRPPRHALSSIDDQPRLGLYQSLAESLAGSMAAGVSCVTAASRARVQACDLLAPQIRTAFRQGSLACSAAQEERREPHA